MKYFLLLASILFSVSTYAQRTCGSHHLHLQKIEEHPELGMKQEEIERFTRDFMRNQQLLSSFAKGEEIIIPVVFHVVYSSTAQNISDTRLIEQIRVLNEDFNGLNADAINTPEAFASLRGTLNLRFVLANRDPNGNPTTGINRFNTTKTSFSYTSDDIKRPASGGVAAWNPNHYLNIWVGNITGGILGYASFPNEAGTSTDGVVLHYRYVGITGASSPYNLGRTATHEVGHYFNLRHIWGDKNNCSDDDEITETPMQYEASSGNPTFPKYDRCSGTFPGIMFMNYMDYSNDRSMNLFTKEQTTRMLAALNGPRATLIGSPGYVGDKEIDLLAQSIEAPITRVCTSELSPRMTIYNLGTRDITSFKVSYKINNGNEVSQTWTGTLQSSKTVNITFPDTTLTAGAYSISFIVTEPNGQNDEDITNNTISKSFTIGSGLSGFPLKEGFESTVPSAGWSINNPDGNITWAKSNYGQGKSGNYSIYINNYEYDPGEFNVDQGEKDDLILPSVDLSNADQANLSFAIAAAQYSALSSTNEHWDTLRVLVSVDCGQTYQTVYEKFKETLVTVSGALTTFYTPKTADWRTDIISLNAFKGYENVQVVFRNISNWENNIYLDDINISMQPNASTGIKNMDLLSGITIYPNPTSGLVSVEIRNYPQGLRQIEWINSLGQVVVDQQRISAEGVYQFNLSDLPGGLYMARFIFEDGQQLAKKVIVR